MSSTRFTDLDVEFADQKHSLNGVDAIEAVSDEEDDDLLDYDDDELSITTLSRQSSIEELELRYMEMHKMQAAVATWAMKEKQAKMEMKLKKMNSYCPMSPVFQEGCEYENCNMFVVSYAIVATILVWAVYGVLLFLYFHTRTNLAYVY
ncbi:uncharacterized protein PHALS_09943 [Plasmopara halstedii]|uniref:Uncharacterized protein n=1 Tax=Plasmopara halstedii TaxID=4781 RepID=A0A0N7L4V2_PLAHL|nr:uncharacterized protein PHALS_09943 [Plasmopara halstedii]CEG39707.1 hypothetical protein PHALS_09943 [Plasmopara halstedii]|eukprot:XP_024576076.1 hypothetical protein PHALS_09943 [Plasmopara halstedii]